MFMQHDNITQDMFNGTIQRAPHMRVISVYNRPIRLLTDHDFTVRCIQVESIARGHWMVATFKDLEV